MGHMMKMILKYLAKRKYLFGEEAVLPDQSREIADLEYAQLQLIILKYLKESIGLLYGL